MTQVSRYLTAPQAARILEVSDQTVRDWVKAGKLPALVYPSGRMRIRRADVEAILRGKSVSAGAA